MSFKPPREEVIWINPVIARMAGSDYPALIETLQGRGYTVESCPEALPEVRNAYLSLLSQPSAGPLIDARCPRIVSLVRKEFPRLSAQIAQIPPILIRCADLLYQRHVAPEPKKANLTIITPCSDLADYGKALFGKRIRFRTWKAFEREEGLRLRYPRTDESPIPLGFFDSTGVRVLGGSGSQTVMDLLALADEGRLDPDVEILELLYCQDGCHNGNGV